MSGRVWPGVALEGGDCREVMRRLVEEGVVVQSVVTDPPYHLTSIVKRFGAADSAPAKSEGPSGVYRRASAGFMGKSWDGGGIAFEPETWRLVYELLPPGGHLAAFGGTRTFHRLAVAIEDAGFEIRDTLAWLYGTGFPKSHDVAKGMKKVGHDATGWDGWGTALKPAFEPIILARRPLSRTVAETVRAHGTGALNVDGCRVGTSKSVPASPSRSPDGVVFAGRSLRRETGTEPGHDPNVGRWPANLLHDGSDEVVALFPQEAGAAAPVHRRNAVKFRTIYGTCRGVEDEGGSTFHGDEGSAARFFYCAKAGSDDRVESKHPTVKPVALMRWLVRLVTPPGGRVLDPFAGTGTTAVAARREGFDALLIERETEYLADIARRLDRFTGSDLFASFGSAGR